MSLLLVALVLPSYCNNWSTAADTSIICEAVRREAAEPSCQPVEDRDAPTTASAAGYPDDESCAANVQSDGAKVMSSDGNYSISGLPLTVPTLDTVLLTLRVMNAVAVSNPRSLSRTMLKTCV